MLLKIDMSSLVYKELIKKNVKDLVELRKKHKRQLFMLRMQSDRNIASLKDKHGIRVEKKNIARINFALHNKINIKNGNN